MYQFLPLPLVLLFGTTRRAWFISLTPIPSQPSLLKAQQDQFPLSFITREMLLSLSHLYSVFWTCLRSSTSLSSRGAQNWAQDSRCGLTRAGSFPDLLAMLFLMYHRIPLAFFVPRSHYCFMDNLLSKRTPRSFPTELLSISLVPSPHPLLKAPCLKALQSHNLKCPSDIISAHSILFEKHDYRLILYQQTSCQIRALFQSSNCLSSRQV